MTPHVLTSDELEVVLLPAVGVRIHSIRAFGELLTHTPADPATHLAEPFAWGGYHMLPWCNRVAPGPVEVLGRTVDLAPNHTDGTAIHGLHYATSWEPAGAAAWRVHGAHPGWPWTYTASVTASVAGPVFALRYELTNTSDAPMPAGVGVHPWFRVPSTVLIPSASVFVDNTGTTPLPEPVAGPRDLRAGVPFAPGVDSSWVDLAEPVVTLAWHAPGIELDLAADDPAIVAVAARPGGVDAVAVELQTHAPDGLRRLVRGEPHPIEVLEPGATRRLTVTFTART